MENTLVFDIGGTSIKYGLIDDNGILRESNEIPTDAQKGGPSVIAKVIHLAKGFNDFSKIGISTAGQVDPVKGAIRYANPNIPNYTGMRIRDLMQKQFHVPCIVENDVNAAALGEAHFGAGKDFKDFLCLTYGTGIGGAIVLNGEIYSGSSYSAGEFGGIITHPEALIKGNILSGCYERYASTTALVRYAQTLDKKLNNGKAIFNRLDEPEIKALIDRWILEIMYGLTSLIHIFNPPAIILGGGIMGQSYILNSIKITLMQYIMPSFNNVKIISASLGNTAGMLGAYYLVNKK